jgi:enoyl-CoA hydratase
VTVQYEERGPVAFIRIDGPGDEGPLTNRSCSELAAAWRTVAATRTVRVAVVAGVWSWDRSSSDANHAPGTVPAASVAYGSPGRAAGELENLPDIELAVLRNVEFPKPVIAVVDGPCLSGGMELLLATDIRVAGADAVFGFPRAPDQPSTVAGVVRLARQIPFASAMEILLTGRLVSADEALRSGLVNRVVGKPDLVGEATSIAEMIAANSPIAVYATKMSAVRGLEVGVGEAYEIERACGTQVFASDDAVEGPEAFSEKRAPRWTDI